MQMPSKRLEQLFGANSEAINADHVKKLVSGTVAEDIDLDFKESLYGGESERRDLSRDVAALANTAGGVILLGVQADEQSQASASPGVDLSDDAKTRMQQIVVAGVLPLPTFEIVAVPSGTDSRGFYAIVVAPIARSPPRGHPQRGVSFPKEEWIDDPARVGTQGGRGRPPIGIGHRETPGWKRSLTQVPRG